MIRKSESISLSKARTPTKSSHTQDTVLRTLVHVYPLAQQMSKLFKNNLKHALIKALDVCISQTKNLATDFNARINLQSLSKAKLSLFKQATQAPELVHE